MRPRPDATENAEGVDYLSWSLEASMRPRPDATENGEHQAGGGGQH